MPQARRARADTMKITLLYHSDFVPVKSGAEQPVRYRVFDYTPPVAYNIPRRKIFPLDERPTTNDERTPEYQNPGPMSNKGESTPEYLNTRTPNYP
jgi:hypothetical protein